MWPRLRLIGAVAILGAFYFEAGSLGLKLAYVHANSTAVWAPTGISLAALLLFGTRLWPGVFIGAFLVNVSVLGDLPTSAAIAAGNTLEALAGSLLVLRFAGGRRFIQQPRTLFAFVLLAALGATTVSATIGVASLMALGAAQPEAFLDIWLSWWLGNAAGAVLFAPLVIAWVDDPYVRATRREVLEAALLLVSVVGCAELVFGGWAPAAFSRFPFLIAPLLLWPAFRFGARLTATALIVVFGIALVRTLQGVGPFANPVPLADLLTLQTFLSVLAVTSMAVASANLARARAKLDLEQSQNELQGVIALLAAECTHDPLTGVANRRGFTERLRDEAERSRRKREPVAMLVVDIDRFKRHNEELGHGAADEILKAVAILLRTQIRACDHVARFGGDEFVLLLPGTDLSGARVTAERCRNAVEQAGWGRRSVTVSIGATAFQVEGDQHTELLSLADQALFRAKAAGRNKVATLGARRTTVARSASAGAF